MMSVKRKRGHTVSNDFFYNVIEMETTDETTACGKATGPTMTFMFYLKERNASHIILSNMKEGIYTMRREAGGRCLGKPCLA